MRVYICCKTLSNRKSTLKNKPRTPSLIAQRDHRETIQVMKLLRVKFTLAKGNVVIHINRSSYESKALSRFHHKNIFGRK